MSKLNAGKASVLVLTVALFVISFLLGMSSTSISAQTNRVLMHHFLGNRSCQEKYVLPDKVDDNPEWEVGPCDTDEVLGCTDQGAINYNENANKDDESCEYDLCLNIEGDQTTLPDGMQTNENHSCSCREGYNEVSSEGLRVADDGLDNFTCVADSTPEPRPTPGDMCTNMDGFQGNIPEGWFQISEGSTFCRQFQYGGAPTPPPATGGQVLGASTMAATGGFMETLYQAIMGLGGILTLKGLKKGKKASR